MCTYINKSSLFSVQTTNRGVVNYFTSQKTTHEQQYDMLHFREIGTESYLNFITHRILMITSTDRAPVRKKKILTMNKPKSTKRRVTRKEKEAKLVTKCLRRRLAWASRSNQSTQNLSDQYSIFPRALADEYGNPHKASKSTWKKKIRSRYKFAPSPVLLSAIPPGWIPQTVIIDAMFLINTTPFRRNKTITDYSHLLFHRFALVHYDAGATDVHLLFDKPNQRFFNPKLFEQSRRDTESTTTTRPHQHISFTPSTQIPSNWRQYIQCRQCKWSIVESIGLALLQTGSQLLKNKQRLILGGCFDGARDAWLIDTGVVPMPTEVYRSNASEADFRVWRHAVCSPSKNILLYSPDTDVYNIGLKFAGLAHKEFIVQLNVIHAEDKQYLHLSNFVNSLCSDPDLACLDKDSLPVTFQVLFLATGCDYISYFKSIGKATFWNVFYQHATFITGQRMPGNLHQINTQGFYSFIRLVGTVYFKKHISGFISRYNYDSPIHLYNSFDPTLSDEMRHQSWLQSIREVVSERITSEEERVPTYTSLWRHWLRTCWCLQLWHASSQEDMYKDLPPPETSGWLQLSDGSYIIDWEDKGVQGEIQSTIDYLISRLCMQNRVQNKEV